MQLSTMKNQRRNDRHAEGMSHVGTGFGSSRRSSTGLLLIARLRVAMWGAAEDFDHVVLDEGTVWKVLGAVHAVLGPSCQATALCVLCGE